MTANLIEVPATVPAPERLWEISYDGQCPSFHSTPHKAAAALADVLTRRLMKGWPQRTLTVRLLDEEDHLVWDATSNVADVIRVTGWPGEGVDRDETIELLAAILVTD